MIPLGRLDRAMSGEFLSWLSEYQWIKEVARIAVLDSDIPLYNNLDLFIIPKYKKEEEEESD